MYKHFKPSLCILFKEIQSEGFSWFICVASICAEIKKQVSFCE